MLKICPNKVNNTPCIVSTSFRPRLVCIPQCVVTSEHGSDGWYDATNTLAMYRPWAQLRCLYSVQCTMMTDQSSLAQSLHVLIFLGGTSFALSCSSVVSHKARLNDLVYYIII